MAGEHRFPSYDGFLDGAAGMFRYLHEPDASSDDLCDPWTGIGGRGSRGAGP